MYFSVDIEADGPIPGDHSMLSLGAVAIRHKDLKQVADISINFELLPGAKPDPETMDFWKKHQMAYANSRKTLVSPIRGMVMLGDWINKNQDGENPVFVAYPAGFDFVFVNWYFYHFLGGSPFRQAALDLQTFAMAILGCEMRQAIKRLMPKDWFNPELKHTHIALDDAYSQAHLFISMMKYRDAKLKMS